MTYEMRVVDEQSVELKFETAEHKIKYVLVEQYQLYVSDWPAEELQAKIEAANMTDEFFDEFYSISLEDCDSTYLDDCEYKEQVLDTMFYYISSSRIQSEYLDS